MLYRRNERLNEVLAMMESVKGQHPDLMKFYEERDEVWEKIFALEDYYSYRRNLFVKEIINKGSYVKSIRYSNFDDWEVEDRRKHNTIFDLLGEVKPTTLTKEQLLDYLNFIEKLPNYRKYDGFSDIVRLAKEVGTLKEHFPLFLKNINRLCDRPKYEAISDLIREAEAIGLINDLFFAFLMIISNIPYEELDIFSDLFKEAKTLKLSKKLFPHVVRTQENMPNHKYDAFSTLFTTLKKTGFTQKYFLVILKAINKLHDKEKYRAFYDLIESSKKTDLINTYYTPIKSLFVSLMNNTDNMCECNYPNCESFHKQEAKKNLFNAIEDTKFEKEFSKVF